MAQLRHDYKKFRELNTEVLVMVPNGPRTIERYKTTNAVPYPILSDKGSAVAGMYMQVKRVFKIGTPTVLLVDQKGRIIYAHYARSVIEEPDNQEPLKILADLKEKSSK
jgi:peroxiredoxin